MKIALFGAHGRVGQAFLRFVQVDDRYIVRSLIRTNREEMLAGMFQVTGNSRNQESVSRAQHRPMRSRSGSRDDDGERA